MGSMDIVCFIMLHSELVISGGWLVLVFSFTYSYSLEDEGGRVINSSLREIRGLV